MVAAQIQIGRVIVGAVQFGRMESIVDAQHVLGVAVGVHISMPACLETVLEDSGQLAVGVGPVSYTHLDVYKRQMPNSK